MAVIRPLLAHAPAGYGWGNRLNHIKQAEYRHTAFDDAALFYKHADKKPKTLPFDLPELVELPSDTAALSTSKSVHDYVYFLASTGRDGEPIDAARFQERVEEIVQGASFIPREASARTEEESVVTVEESVAAVVTLTANSRGFSASFAAEAEAHLHGEFRAEDGTTVSIDAEVRVSVSASVTVQQNAALPATDPLALDLDRNGTIFLSGPQNFDIDADGSADRVAFAAGPDAFLGLDRNGNGRIDDGGELFGDQHGAANGFEELAKFDTDQNGLIDERDAVFESLVAVRLTGGEFVEDKLAQLGISSIGLEYSSAELSLSGGNTIAQRGRYTSTDGSIGNAFDVMLSRGLLV